VVSENDTILEVVEGEAGPHDLLAKPKRIDGLGLSLGGLGGGGRREGGEDRQGGQKARKPDHGCSW